MKFSDFIGDMIFSCNSCALIGYVEVSWPRESINFDSSARYTASQASRRK